MNNLNDYFTCACPSHLSAYPHRVPIDCVSTKREIKAVEKRIEKDLKWSLKNFEEEKEKYWKNRK